MIQNISTNKLNNVIFGKDNKNNSEKRTSNKEKLKTYADSFVRNTKETATGTLLITGAWSLFDNKFYRKPFKEAFKNNFKMFFLPVTLFTALLCSAVENSNNKNKK